MMRVNCTLQISNKKIKIYKGIITMEDIYMIIIGNIKYTGCPTMQ